MKLNFLKASPAQNLTALITNYVSPYEYSSIANKAMEGEYLYVEQVGFIVAPKHEGTLLRLEMSGGEFCGNALLSAAAYCTYKDLIEKETFFLETSGANRPLICRVQKKESNLYEVKAEMPDILSQKSVNVKVKKKNITGSLIQLDGITHFVTDYLPTREEYTEILHELIYLVKDEAIGIIPYKYLRDNEYNIAPFVYVAKTRSKVFERACGSGTLALGKLLAQEANLFNLEVHQPGGAIKVEIGSKNFISAYVRFTSEGTVHID